MSQIGTDVRRLLERIGAPDFTYVECGARSRGTAASSRWALLRGTDTAAAEMRSEAVASKAGPAVFRTERAADAEVTPRPEAARQPAPVASEGGFPLLGSTQAFADAVRHG